MQVFFTVGQQIVEEKECTAVDIVLEQLIIRVRNSGVSVLDKTSKEELFNREDAKGG